MRETLLVLAALFLYDLIKGLIKFICGVIVEVLKRFL